MVWLTSRQKNTRKEKRKEVSAGQNSQSHMEYSGSELKLWFTQAAGRAESAGEEMSKQVLQAAEARQTHICPHGW